MDGYSYMEKQRKRPVHLYRVFKYLQLPRPWRTFELCFKYRVQNNWAGVILSLHNTSIEQIFLQRMRCAERYVTKPAHVSEILVGSRSIKSDAFIYPGICSKSELDRLIFKIAWHRRHEAVKMCLPDLCSLTHESEHSWMNGLIYEYSHLWIPHSS